MTRQIRYSTPYLAALCATFFVMIIAGTITFERASGEGAMVGLMFVVFGILGLPPMVRYLFSGGLILEYNHSNVIYHGLLGTRTIPWTDVRSILIKTQNSGYPMNRFLKLKGPFSLLGSASITERLLEKRFRPLESLKDELLAAREGKLPADPVRAPISAPIQPPVASPPQPSRASWAAAPVSQAQPSQFGAMPDTRSNGVIGEMPGQTIRKRGLFGRKS